MKNQSVAGNKSFSPSAGKPAALLAALRAMKLPIQVKRFEPCTPFELASAHDAKYVKEVLSCKTANGFGNNSPEIAASLPYTSGSMVAATLHALRTGDAAASLTSGFHHACYENGGGFCTFNGLIVAAQAARAAGAKKVGIIDCDAHFGNGTKDIIEKLGLDYIEHYTFGGDRLARKDTSKKWLKRFKKLLCNFRECDVILYQAGADPHENDPLGGVLTTEQMRKRDNIVFKFAKENAIPVAWNLAGGYQNPLEKVLELHINTVLECLKSAEGK